MRKTRARVVRLAGFSSPRPGPRKGGGRVERRRGKGVRGEGGKGGKGYIALAEQAGGRGKGARGLSWPWPKGGAGGSHVGQIDAKSGAMWVSMVERQNRQRKDKEARQGAMLRFMVAGTDFIWLRCRGRAVSPGARTNSGPQWPTPHPRACRDMLKSVWHAEDDLTPGVCRERLLMTPPGPGDIFYTAAKKRRCSNGRRHGQDVRFSQSPGRTSSTPFAPKSSSSRSSAAAAGGLRTRALSSKALRPARPSACAPSVGVGVKAALRMNVSRVEYGFSPADQNGG